MNRIFIIAFCVSCLWTQQSQAQTLRSVDDLRDVTRQAMGHVLTGDFGAVFDTMAPHWPLPENELAMLSVQTLTQRNMLGQRFGKTVGVDLASEQLVGDTIMRITYIEKFEVHLIRWVFTFYKPGDEWLVNGIV